MGGRKQWKKGRRRWKWKQPQPLWALQERQRRKHFKAMLDRTLEEHAEAWEMLAQL